MADGKKSFVAYSDWDGMFQALPDEIAGKLIKHVFAYVNDRNPSSDEYVITALFEPLKATLKRDLKKWEEQREQRIKAGKKSAEIRSTKPNERSTVVDETERNSTVSVSENVSVTVNTTKEIQNNTLKGEKHFEHIKEFYSHPYEKQFAGFKKEHSAKDYESFQKFLSAMFRDFTIEQLTTNFDKCIAIGDWKKVLQSKGFMIIKPALEKAIAAKEGNREQMALRIKTFTNGLFDEKVFVK